MAIENVMCVSAKLAMLNGELDFSTDTTQTFRLALYTDTATLGSSTAAYTTDDEVADGGGYSAGGELMTLAGAPTSSGVQAYIDFDNVTWTGATITARGAMAYVVGDGTALFTLDFGENKTVSGGNYVVNIPAPAAGSAIFRLT